MKSEIEIDSQKKKKLANGLLEGKGKERDWDVNYHYHFQSIMMHFC